MEKVYKIAVKRCNHNKAKKVCNGDWEWLECVKCGKKVDPEDYLDTD